MTAIHGHEADPNYPYGPVAPQPAPLPTDGPAIWDLVIADMRERDRLGREKYGRPLQAHNGRDALVDAYQEALDLCVYLRQAIEERVSDTPKLPSIGDVFCECPNCHWRGTVSGCIPDVNGNGSLGCPDCRWIVLAFHKFSVASE
jgi:hypothetical protein